MTIYCVDEILVAVCDPEPLGLVDAERLRRVERLCHLCRACF